MCRYILLHLSGVILLISPMSPTHADSLVYVANQDSGVSVINTAAAVDFVIAQVPLGSAAGDVAITPDDAFAWVTDIHSDEVAVIDIATNTVEARVSVGSIPFRVAITPDGAYAWVTNSGSSNVSVINTATYKVETTVALAEVPTGVAITPDGAHAWVTNRPFDTVSVINTATYEIEDTVPVGVGPWDVAITPDGAFAYVANNFSDNVSVINTATKAVDATVAVGDNPAGLAITPEGKFAWVTNYESGNISVINTATHSVDVIVPVDDTPSGVAIAPDGETAWVAHDRSDEFEPPPTKVSVINTATKLVEATVPMAGRPVRVAVTHQPRHFFDVPPDYWAYSPIEALARAGITSGCSGGNYCPSSPLTRAQMAVFLERSMNGSDYVPPVATGNTFLDVGASDFAAAFIEQMLLDGITGGCGDGNYCPDDSVTRAQMAVFLLRAKHGASYSPPAPTGVFDDVNLAYWAVAWIEQLAAEGISAGCGGRNYCPDDPVTRAQMAVFLVRTFEL